MAKASNTINGKGFEYACLMAIHDDLRARGKTVEIRASKAFNTTQSSYAKLTDRQQENFMMAAKTAV